MYLGIRRYSATGRRLCEFALYSASIPIKREDSLSLHKIQIDTEFTTAPLGFQKRFQCMAPFPDIFLYTLPLRIRYSKEVCSVLRLLICSGFKHSYPWTKAAPSKEIISAWKLIFGVSPYFSSPSSEVQLPVNL